MISDQFPDSAFEHLVADLEREVEQLKLQVERKKAKQKEIWRKEEELEERQYVPKLHKISSNPTLNYLQAKQYLMDRNKQSKLLLTELEAEEISLREKLQRVSNAIDRDEKITGTLKTKVAEYHEELVNRPAKDPEYERRSLLRKATVVNVRFKKLSRLMKNFMLEHFPRPTANEIREAATEYDEDEDTERVNGIRGDVLPGIGANGLHVKSLSDIIEILVNKHFESPKDKYVTLDDTYWTPYVELLVRYGIAAQKPDDAMKLQLRTSSALNGF